jgi:hypothetical protein
MDGLGLRNWTTGPTYRRRRVNPLRYRVILVILLDSGLAPAAQSAPGGRGPRGDGRVRGPVREVTRLDGGRPAGALRDVNPLTRKGL